MRRGGRLLGPRQAPEPLVALLALVAGTALGLVHLPFPQPWLAFLPLALVFWLVAREPTPRLGARAAFLAGLAFWTVHLFWIPQSFSSWLHWSVWLYMPLVWPIEAAFWAAAAWISHALARRAVPTLFAFAGAIVVLEWLRAQGPLAFPWGDLGYTLLGTPLAQVASLGGVQLASLIVAVSAAGVAALMFGRARPLGWAAGLVALALVFGVTRPAPPEPDELALLVQGNINPVRRTRGLGAEDLAVYSRLSEGAAPGTLVVWPEAAVTLDAARQSPLARLVTGAVDGRLDARINLVASLAAGGVSSTSPKARLVPFGEYFPLRQELGFVYDPVFGLLGLPGFNSSVPGLPTRPLDLGSDRIAAYVCYESVFASTARDLVARGSNVLVNVSNDGWFGDTAGVFQHFQMGRMRAIETGRYLLRAGNTGITAQIDPLGRVVGQLPRDVEGTLPAAYARLENLTPYVRFGDWAVLAALAMSLASVWAGRRRRYSRFWSRRSR